MFRVKRTVAPNDAHQRARVSYELTSVLEFVRVYLVGWGQSHQASVDLTCPNFHKREILRRKSSARGDTVVGPGMFWWDICSIASNWRTNFCGACAQLPPRGAISWRDPLSISIFLVGHDLSREFIQRVKRRYSWIMRDAGLVARKASRCVV